MFWLIRVQAAQRLEVWVSKSTRAKNLGAVQTCEAGVCGRQEMYRVSVLGSPDPRSGTGNTAVTNPYQKVYTIPGFRYLPP